MFLVVWTDPIFLWRQCQEVKENFFFFLKKRVSLCGKSSLPPQAAFLTRFRDLPESVPVFWEAPAPTGAPLFIHPGRGYPSPPSVPLFLIVGSSGACAALAGGFSDPGCAGWLWGCPALPTPHWAPVPASLHWATCP